MANERALLDVINDPDALNQFFEYAGADFSDGDQVVSDTSVAELFDGLSAEDYPVLSLSAEDMTNGDEWNFMPLVQSTEGFDTPSVQPSWFQPSLVMTGASAMQTDVSASMPIYNHVQSGCSSSIQGQSSRSSTVLITNSPLTSRLSAVQQTVQIGATQTITASPQASNGSPVRIQYTRSPANSAPTLRQQFVQTQQTPSQQLQILQQQQPQQHVQFAAASQVQAGAGSGNTGSGLTLIQMPNGQYVVQQQQQQSSIGSVQQLIGGGHLVIQQQQPSGNLQQLGIQTQQPQQQQQMIQQQGLTQGVAGGQIMLQTQQHQLAGQVVIQQQPVVQHQNYISVPQGMNARPQFNLGSVRGIQLPNGEVQLVNSAQVGMLGSGSMATQGQQIVLQQQQQPSMATVMQGNTSIMHGNSTVLHGNAGASNVVYQTMPLTSGSGCISATNFVQINQFGGSNMQSQQVLQPSDQQGSSILLSLNQSTSPAPAGDQFTDRNVASGSSDLLVQINGQTYRLHNVQQTPPQNAPSPPVQIIAGNVENTVQLNARSATPHLLQQQVQQQQQHPVQVMQVNQMMAQQSAAQVMHTLSAGQASSPSIPVRQLAVSSQSLQQMQQMQQMQLAIGGQSTSVGSGSLSAAHPPNQSNNPPLGNQTITLTQSQLAIIQQAPPNKQLKLLQILQRQQMLRAVSGNQSVTVRPEAVANGLAVSSSVASSTFLQASNSPSGVRPFQQSVAASLQTSSASLRPGQAVLQRPMQGMVSQVQKPVSAVGVQIARPGQSIITASQAQGTVLASGVRTVGSESATHAGARVLPRPLMHSAALSAITTASANQLQVSQTVLPQVNPPRLVGMASMSASSVNQNISAVRLPVMMMGPTASTPQKGTDSLQLATSNSSTSAAKMTTVRLTTQQQTLLLKVQNQLQTLSNVPQRTAEQDRFLQMLMNAQQQILAQGQAQLQNQLQAEKYPTSVAAAAASVSSPSNARLAVTTSTTTTALRPTAAVLRPPLPTTIPRLTGLPQIGCRAEAPSINVPSSSPRQIIAQTTVSSKLPMNVPSAVSATQNQSLDNLFRSFPNFREKLEAEFAKMTPERREWIKSNQSLIFAKLQQRQMEIQQKAMPMASGSGTSSSEVKPIATSLSTSVTQPVIGTAVNVLASGPTLTRKQLFQMYLLKDQKRATQPDCKTPFDSQKDILKRLVPFHVYQTGMNTVEQIDKAESTYEEHARQLLDRKDAMFNKYRHLLLLESMKKDSSADAVMLGRMFLNDERGLLKEDRRLAAEDPDSFVPRPVLVPVKVEKIEQAQNEVKTEATDEACRYEKTAVKLESDVNNVPVADYVVRPSKGLTIVLKNRASPCPSPPSQTATLKSSTDSVLDVRVKLERCDNDEPTIPSPKRARLAADKTCISNVLNKNISRCSEIEASGDASEDDAAVASLLGCNAQDDCLSLGRLGRSEVSTSAQVIEDNSSDDENIEADSYVNCEPESLFMHTGTRDDKHDELYADNDVSQNYQEEQGFFSGFEESVDGAVESFESYKEQMQTDSQLMSAVGTLMADLGQLNEDAIALSASQSVQQYSSVTNRESGNGSNSIVQSHMQYAVNSIIGFQQHSTSQTSVVSSSSSCFDRTRISAASVDHDSDLDAAVQSILT